MTCTTGIDKDKGGYYIFQHIVPLVWAKKPVVRFAPLVRLTPLSPIGASWQRDGLRSGQRPQPVEVSEWPDRARLYVGT